MLILYFVGVILGGLHIAVPPFYYPDFHIYDWKYEFFLYFYSVKLMETVDSETYLHLVKGRTITITIAFYLNIYLTKIFQCNPLIFKPFESVWHK